MHDKSEGGSFSFWSAMVRVSTRRHLLWVVQIFIHGSPLKSITKSLMIPGIRWFGQTTTPEWIGFCGFKPIGQWGISGLGPIQARPELRLPVLVQVEHDPSHFSFFVLKGLNYSEIRLQHKTFCAKSFISIVFIPHMLYKTKISILWITL